MICLPQIHSRVLKQPCIRLYSMLQNDLKFFFYLSIFFFKFLVFLLDAVCSWRTTDYKVHRVCRHDEGVAQVHIWELQQRWGQVCTYGFGGERRWDNSRGKCGGDAELDRMVSGCWPEYLELADNMFFISIVCFWSGVAGVALTTPDYISTLNWVARYL